MKKLLCISMLSLALATPAIGQTKRDRFAAAEDAITAKQFDEAVQILGDIGDDKKLKLEDRTRALSRQFDILRQQKKFDDAIASIQKQLALPADVQRQKQLSFSLADVQVAAGKLDAGIATLSDMATKYADDADTVTQADLTIAGHYGREKQFGKSAEAYQAAYVAMGGDDPRAADTLWNVSQQYFVGEQYDKAIAATQQLLDERYRNYSLNQNGQTIERIAAAYLKLKKPADAIALFRKQESDDPNPLARSKWCLRAAQAAQQAGDQQAARDAYRRLVIDHAGDGSTDGWWDAQASYIDGLVAANQLAEALKHTHILIDAAADTNQLTSAVSRAVDLIQKVDGNKKRVKDLVNGQLYGLAGKDGKPGTADDLKDVLKDIGYPTDADRDAAFAKAFADIGDDAAAMFHRGQLCIFSGHPTEALAFYAEATRRAGFNEWTGYANALVMNGLRSTRGPGGLDEAVKFLLSGEGENPFKDVPAIGSTPWPSPQLSAADKATLTAVMAGLQQLAVDPSIGAEACAAAVRSYGRAAEALGGAVSGEPFYGLITEGGPQPVREQATALVLRLERGGELHLGKVKAFLAAEQLSPATQKRVDAAFQQTVKPLMKLQQKGGTTPRVQPVKD